MVIGRIFSHGSGCASKFKPHSISFFKRHRVRYLINFSILICSLLTLRVEWKLLIYYNKVKPMRLHNTQQVREQYRVIWHRLLNNPRAVSCPHSNDRRCQPFCWLAPASVLHYSTSCRRATSYRNKSCTGFNEWKKSTINTRGRRRTVPNWCHFWLWVFRRFAYV